MEHPKRVGEIRGEIKWHILQASQISWGSDVSNSHMKGAEVQGVNYNSKKRVIY